MSSVCNKLEEVLIGKLVVGCFQFRCNRSIKNGSKQKRPREAHFICYWAGLWPRKGKRYIYKAQNQNRSTE